jgi:hypothetical protein
MALARIITHSQACSRELALDLLARGYAVEIISPDSIPNDIADLELRVATGPGDQLIASVEAHNGERTASLEFLHQLKSPMADFIRRPPEPRESAHPPKEPVSFLAVPNVEAVELSAEAPQPAPKAVSPAADVLPAPELDRQEAARLILPPEPLPSVPVEPPSSCAVEASTIARPTIVETTLVETTTLEPTTVQPREEPQPPDRPTGWRWRAALTFASVVLLALVLGFGLRRTGKASAQGSAAAPAENVAAASTDVGLSSGAIPARDPQKDPGQVLAAPAIRSEGNSNHAPEESPVAKAGAATASIANASIAEPSIAEPSIAKPSSATPSAAKASTTKPSTAQAEAMTSHRLGADLVARDTVTYFDERASNETARRAKPAKRFAQQHQRSGKYNGGVIAANTVTYFDKKPTPKAANRNSGVKRPSEPN